MIEICSQMREFVNFAQDAVAGNGKNSIARLGKQESRYSAFSISAATDGDSVGKLRRSAASKNANNIVRTKFRDAVAQMFGGADKIPESVRAAMNMQDYEKGKPLTADRILDVYAAIKEHISGLKNAALNDGTLRAIDVADTAADQFVEKFKARCTPPPMQNTAPGRLIPDHSGRDDGGVCLQGTWDLRQDHSSPGNNPGRLRTRVASCAGDAGGVQSGFQGKVHDFRRA